MVGENAMLEETAPSMEDAAAVPSVEVVKVGNKLCPVSKHKVGEMGPPVEISYNGKVYNLCCSMCVKDFLKDPEKFSKVAEDEVKAQE